MTDRPPPSDRRWLARSQNSLLAKYLPLLLLLGMSTYLGCASPFRPASPSPLPGGVHGRFSAGHGDSTPASPHPVVVYLDPLEGADHSWIPTGEVTVRQRDHLFSPSFAVVIAGQSVRFQNEDEVYHRIFSYSEPNRFDLGVLRQGDSKTLTLQHEGAVRFYCSLHPWERGTFFVSPSPYFDTIDPPGTYEILGVPPGRYQLRSWSESTPSVARVVTVHGGDFTPIDLTIGGRSEAR